MKYKSLALALFMGFALFACAQKPVEAEAVEGEGTEAAPVVEKPKTAKDYLPSKALKDSVSYLVGINFGSFIKGYNFGDDLNYSAIIKGIKDFIAAEGDPRDPEFGKNFKVSPDKMNEMFNSYLQNRQEYAKIINEQKGAEFLAKNKEKAGVQVTESGLQYEIIEAGAPDTMPGPKDTVYVHYKGTLIDGTVFDECAEDKDPIHFTLDRVIKGWSEGLQLIGVGGKAKLYIPAELGYGSQGTRGIEPNSTLIFDVELTDVKKFVEPEAAE